MAKDAKASDLYKDSLESLKGMGNVATALGNQMSKIKDITDDTASEFEDVLDLGQKLLQNQKNVFSEGVDILDIEKKIAKARKDGNDELVESLLAIRDVGKKQAANKTMAEKSLKSYQDKSDKIKTVVGKIPGIGGDLKDIMDQAGAAYKDGLAGLNDDEMLKGKGAAKMKAFGAASIAVVGIIGKQLKGAIQSTGMTIGDAFSRPEFLLFGAEANAIADEFGNMDSSSVKLAASMRLTAFLTGVTAENQAKIMGMMAATSDSSLEVLKSQMMAYQKAGVPFKAIMDDVAGNTEHFAKFAKDGGANIFEAAQRAKELGVNLSDVASISNSLLDFESSIEKQMEAQVLLGKNISLDKARQLAFTGDQAGMMDEIVKQVGGEAEFNKMTVVQRQALADSVGLSVERMGALVRAEEQNAAAADKTRSKYIAMGAILGALIGLVVGGLTLGTALPAALGAMGAGAAAGGLIGGGIGAMFPMSDGGTVTGPTNALIGEKGPEMVTPLPAAGAKMDTRALETKLDELIKINTVMSQNILDIVRG